MDSRAFWLSLSLLLALAAPAHGASIEGLRSHIQALDSLHLKAKMLQANGDTASYELYYRAPYFFTQNLHSNDRQQVVVFDAPRATIAYPHLEFKKQVFLNERGQKRIARKLPLLGLLAGLLAGGDTASLSTKTVDQRFIVHAPRGLRVALTTTYRPVRIDHPRASLLVTQYSTNSPPPPGIQALIETYGPEDKRPKTDVSADSETRSDTDLSGNLLLD